MDFLVGLLTWMVPLIVAVTVHEAAHGFVAGICGDNTARVMGRVTLNPIPHIDLIGSIALPVTCLIMQIGFIFGYAKPVPVNPQLFKKPRTGMVLVALAGPFSNLFLAVVSAAMFHLGEVGGGEYGKVFRDILRYSVILNVVLFLFNLLPVPPLDGGRVIMSILPASYSTIFIRSERYGILFVFGILVLMPIIGSMFGADLGQIQRLLYDLVIEVARTIFNIVGLK